MVMGLVSFWRDLLSTVSLLLIPRECLCHRIPHWISCAPLTESELRKYFVYRRSPLDSALTRSIFSQRRSFSSWTGIGALTESYLWFCQCGWRWNYERHFPWIGFCTTWGVCKLKVKFWSQEFLKLIHRLTVMLWCLRVRHLAIGRRYQRQSNLPTPKLWRSLDHQLPFTLIFLVTWSLWWPSRQSLRISLKNQFFTLEFCQCCQYTLSALSKYLKIYQCKFRIAAWLSPLF